ncbi:hypothetical protein N665_0322s0010 [Sinapis alba]|nr:hypothetical protein N665_0322s0010 [Sinapis alba]
MEFWRRKKEKEKARKCFLENGSRFLEQLIGDCNGLSNPIRMFSSAQIVKATNHFDPKCLLPELLSEYSKWKFTWYKGVIDGRSYAIKRFLIEICEEYITPYNILTHYNDIVLSSRVSNHIGFLKLIGCCLEFHHPVLVFEDLEYTSLNFRGSLGSEVLPWNVRLKIAKEVATAITYLHTAFPRIIIHRDISATNVFLDKNGRATLTDFSRAVTLPEGKTGQR